jgi:hypothetical protein
VYPYALSPFFTFLDSMGSGGEQNSWTNDFQAVRHAVAEYQEEQLVMREAGCCAGVNPLAVVPQVLRTVLFRRAELSG